MSDYPFDPSKILRDRAAEQHDEFRVGLPYDVSGNWFLYGHDGYSVVERGAWYSVEPHGVPADILYRLHSKYSEVSEGAFVFSMGRSLWDSAYPVPDSIEYIPADTEVIEKNSSYFGYGMRTLPYPALNDGTIRTFTPMKYEEPVWKEARVIRSDTTGQVFVRIDRTPEEKWFWISQSGRYFSEGDMKSMGTTFTIEVGE